MRYCTACRAILPTHKVCSKCGASKTINNFSAAKTKNGLSARCIACTRQASRDSALKNKYGITQEEYDQIKQLQGGTCAICQVAKGIVKALAVDHDHKIAEEKGLRASVRGLLCSRCNEILGHLRDDPVAFERAAEYLRNPPSRTILDGDIP